MRAPRYRIAGAAFACRSRLHPHRTAFRRALHGCPEPRFEQACRTALTLPVITAADKFSTTRFCPSARPRRPAWWNKPFHGHTIPFPV